MTDTSKMKKLDQYTRARTYTFSGAFTLSVQEKAYNGRYEHGCTIDLSDPKTVEWLKAVLAEAARRMQGPNGL